MTWNLANRDDDAIKSLFTDYEFTSLGKRLFGKDFQSGRGHSSSVESDDAARTEIIKADLKTLTDFKTKYTHSSILPQH